MHEYQERSNSSPKIAAAQAYQRKIAAQQASSNGGGQEEEPLPKINRDLMYKAYQARLLQLFPSQQVQQEKESDSASPASTADVVQTSLEEPHLHGMMMSKLQIQAAGQQTDGEAILTQADAKTEEVGQEVQAKGDWQEKADTNTIFSNGSALPPTMMAKYENLMPGVSLDHVSVHQGRQVDAALGAAKLQGLTDGTNIAVSSKAPQGTLEHEIGHVGQRQEKGFSLNEVNRQAHEVDADNISAKLLSDQPVERFEQEKQAAKEAPDRDSAKGQHQSSPAHSIDRNITAKQSGVMMGKLTQEESPAGEILDRQQKFDRTETSGTEEETSADKRSTQFEKNADGEVENDTNLAQNPTHGGYNSFQGFQFPAAASPLPTGKTNPQAIIGIHVFIRLVQDVEKAYSSDSPKQTVTRIRNLFYSSHSPAIRGLLPYADNDELIDRGFGQTNDVAPFLYATRLREVRRGDVKDATYNRLTSQADENAVRGKPKGDNPSPYILLPNSQIVDVGHLLLALDAKLNPGSWAPYTSYNIPTIDPASWVADIGIASVWVTTHEYSGKPNDQAPPKMTLSKPPKKSELDEYYKASAPEADLLGNADGFGLFNDWNSSQSLSEALRNYYVGPQGRRAGMRRRWLKFCLLNGFVTNENDQVKWKPKSQLMKGWVPRIDNFCNLYAGGPKKAQETILPFGISRYKHDKWAHTPYMLNKFLDYVITNLSAELRSGV
jgi:hypothetical protein